MKIPTQEEIYNENNQPKPFDLEKFKEYVDTYEATKHGMDNPEIIAKDMLYGIGMCLDSEKYVYAGGFRRFVTYIKDVLCKREIEEEKQWQEFKKKGE